MKKKLLGELFVIEREHSRNIEDIFLRKSQLKNSIGH